MNEWNRIEWKFLRWWGKNGGYFLVVLIIGLFSFRSIFGNYPQWEYEKRFDVLSQYFEEGEGSNLELFHFSDSEKIFYIKFKYKDGFIFDNQINSRPDLEAITEQYKAIILEKVCLSEELTDQLHFGQKISIDVLDGDHPWGVSYLFNMYISYDRCYT